MDVIYVASYYTEEIIDDLDYTTHSYAANSKKSTILSALRENDDDVTVLSPITTRDASFSYTPSKRYEHPEEDVEIIVPSILDVPILNYIWLLLATTYLLLRESRRLNPDNVLFYNFLPHTGFPSTFVGYVLQIPITVEYEDGNFAGEDLPRKITEIALLLISRPVLTGGICVNRPLADKLSTDNTAIVRGRPSIGMPSEDEVKSFPTDSFTVMFAGRFDELRGIDPFLSVAQRYASTHTDIEFWISGYGPGSDRVEAEVDELDQPNVRFFGTLDKEDYIGRLFSSDVLVNLQDPRPLISEYTFPSKLLDFMVTGDVIVSTKMSDLQSEFGEEMVFTDFGTSSIWATISDIETNREAYEPMGKNARARVEDEGSLETIATKLESVLS